MSAHRSGHISAWSTAAEEDGGLPPSARVLSRVVSVHKPDKAAERMQVCVGGKENGRVKEVRGPGTTAERMGRPTHLFSLQAYTRRLGLDARTAIAWAPGAATAAAAATASAWQDQGRGVRTSAPSTSTGGRRPRSVSPVLESGGKRGVSRVAAARAAYAAPPRMETVRHTALRIINIGTVSLYDVIGEAQVREES